VTGWLASVSCRVLGHHWVTRQYHDERTHEFRVCERCGGINNDLAGYPRTSWVRQKRRSSPFRSGEDKQSST
jgi:hypothetical protein